MSNTIKEFVVSLGFDVDEAGLSKFMGGVARASTIALGLGAAAAAMGGAVLAAVQHVAGEYDALDKLATRFRTTADAVDEFKDIASVLGLSEAQSDLTTFDRAIADTALGLGRAKKVFEEIGIAVTDAGGKLKPTIELFDEVSAKIKGMERGKQIAIMERLGLDPALLKLATADLAYLRGELEGIDKATGFNLDDAVKSSKKFMGVWKGMKVEWSLITTAVNKLYESILVKIMPALTDAVADFKDKLKELRHWAEANLAGVPDVIAQVLGFAGSVFSGVWRLLGRAVDLVADAIKGIIKIIKSLPPEFKTAAEVVLGLAAAWWVLNSAILASPITWIALLAGALLLLWDDYKTWKEGGKSLIDWGAWKSEIDAVVGFFGTLKDIGQKTFEVLFAVVDAFAKLLRGDFSGAWDAVKDAVQSVFDIFKDMLSIVGKLIDAMGKVLGMGDSVTTKIGDKLKVAADNTFAVVPSAAGYDALGAGMYGGAMPAYMASVGAAGGAGSNNNSPTTLNQTVAITVQGAGDPSAVGNAVAGEQNRAASDALRNAKGSTR